MAANFDQTDGDGDSVGDSCDICLQTPACATSVEQSGCPLMLCNGVEIGCDPSFGDVNNDGRMNGADIAAFLEVLKGTDTDPLHVSRADVNCDGLANIDDVEPFVFTVLRL
jgi:hypothetical protein